MKFIYLFSALALTLTFGCNNPTDNETQTAETINAVEVEAAASDAVVDEESETATVTDSESDSTAIEDAEVIVNE